MKKTNTITVIYKKPKKYFVVIDMDIQTLENLCKKVCDTYDEAVKSAHEYNAENNEEYYYIVSESKYYTGSKNVRFFGLEFE